MTGQAAFAAYLLAGAPQTPPGPARLKVYRNNVAAALTGALAVRYPAVKRLVGDDFFGGLATAFARARPPSSPVLIHYGEDFPAFIAAFPPARDLPWLGDVAELESRWWQAYHAADRVSLAPDDFAAITPDALADTRFKFHPSVSLMRSPWPVASILERQRGDGDLAGLDMAVAENALVRRHGLTVIIETLTGPLAHSLVRLIAGAPLGDLFAQDGEAAAAALAVIVQTHIVTDIETSCLPN